MLLILRSYVTESISTDAKQFADLWPEQNHSCRQKVLLQEEIVDMI